MRCDSPAALQERFDRELQRQVVAQGNQSTATETDGPANANGVSDATGRGEEQAAEGTNERLEQVIDRIIYVDLICSLLFVMIIHL